MRRSRIRMHWPRVCCTVALVAVSLPPSPLGAQTPDRALEIEDFGFTDELPASAGLHAFPARTTFAFDAAALLSNPSTLARALHRQATLSLVARAIDTEYEYAGSSTRWDDQELVPGFAGGLFPIPVLRGALVPAVAVHRVFSSRREIAYSGLNADDQRIDTFLLQQTGTTYGFTIGAGMDLSSAICGGISLTVLEGGIDALRQYEMRDDSDPAPARTIVAEDAIYDVEGIGARVGVHMVLHPRLIVAATFQTPQVLTVEAAVVREETIQIPGEIGSFERRTSTPSTEYVIPYHADVGIAVPAGRLRVCAELGFTNWAQASVERVRLRTRDNRSVLRRVYDLRAGLEWTGARPALRLRAGVTHRRGAAEFLQGDRVDNDHLEPIRSETGGTTLSGGAALLLGTKLVIEAGVGHTSRERRASTVGDRIESTTLSLAGSYWF